MSMPTVCPTLEKATTLGIATPTSVGSALRIPPVSTLTNQVTPPQGDRQVTPAMVTSTWKINASSATVVGPVGEKVRS